MQTAREAKAMEIRDWHGRTILLKPSVGCCFAAYFLVLIARVNFLSNTAWQRKADNHTPLLVSVLTLKLPWIQCSGGATQQLCGGDER